MNVYSADLERRREAILAHMKRCMAERVCLKCETPVEKYDKVGKCVYADPCGHRQWQGALPT